MAKRNTDHSSSGDTAKVRVFFAEVEGNNQSVQDALKTMVSAMSRPSRTTVEQGPNGRGVLPTFQADDSQEMLDQPEEFEETLEQPNAPTSRKPRGTGKKVDRNAGLKLVPDLNFRPSGEPSLKQFVDEKKPKSDLETTLAVVYYMHHTMKLSKIGPAHVMTAFKEAGKQIPASLKQTIRNIKSEKIWLNFSDIEDIQPTTQGDNFVEHEMGKSDSA